MSLVKLAAIAACSPNRVIGYQGRIPWHSPVDLRHFKTITEHSVLIMGRKTLESLPSLLPNRIHLVVSQDPEKVMGNPWYQEQLHRFGPTYIEKTIRFLPSLDLQNLDSELNLILKLNPKFQPWCYVAGGEHLYKQLLPFCHLLYLTKVSYHQDFTLHNEAIVGDTYFPEVNPDQWHLITQKSCTDGSLNLCFQLLANLDFPLK
jgi:dihydrofolate reductase